MGATRPIEELILIQANNPSGLTAWEKKRLERYISRVDKGAAFEKKQHTLELAESDRKRRKEAREAAKKRLLNAGEGIAKVKSARKK
jgi:hypothetical protein